MPYENEKVKGSGWFLFIRKLTKIALWALFAYIVAAAILEVRASRRAAKPGIAKSAFDSGIKLRPLKKSGLIPRRGDSLDEGSNPAMRGKGIFQGFCNGLKLEK